MLTPSNIGGVDVMDTRPVLAYVRDAAEWDEVVNHVYMPFVARNKAAHTYTSTLTNRVQLDNFGIAGTSGLRRSTEPAAAQTRET